MNAKYLVSTKPSTVKLLLYRNRRNELAFLKLRQISTSKVNFNESGSEEAPKSAKKSRNGLKFFALAVTGFTVGLGYATFNPDSRRQIESMVPQSNQVFEYIDSLVKKAKDSIPAMPGLPPIPSMPSIKSMPGYDILNRGAELEKKPEAKPATVIQPPPPPIIETKPEKKEVKQEKPVDVVVVPAPVITITQAEPVKTEIKQEEKTIVAEKKIQTKVEPKVAAKVETKPEPIVEVKEEPPKPVEKITEKDKEELKNIIKKFQLQDEATVEALEAKLKTLESSVKSRVSEAVSSSELAVQSLDKYRQALRNALDEANNEDNKDVQWKLVTDLFEIQSGDVNEANQKISSARSSIEALDKCIKEVKQSELGKNIKNIRDVQLDLVNLHHSLENEQAKLSESIIHANVLRNFTHEQKIARSQFLKEMQALQPEGVLNRSEDQLTNEELNNLLIHAHKRVLQLQKQIEKMQLSQNQEIQSALEEQRKQNADLLRQTEERLREVGRKEFSIEKDKLVEAERVKSVAELKRELARQAAAHNLHLAQMLRIQEEELQKIYQQRLILEREKIHKEFYEQVAEALGRLKGIEQALHARANLEHQASNAKQMWLAVQNMSELLSNRVDELVDLKGTELINNELIDIKSNVDTIRKSAPDNEFIQSVLSGVSSSALENGVWTEPDLKDRFYRLKNICRRVALVDERGASLFKYFISYLQSFFIFETKIDKETLDLSRSDALKLDNLNTFTILDYAQHFIENGDLELAIKLLQQLKGEPRRLAKDWIRDAVLLLEVKQTCQLLNTYISGVYIGTKIQQ